MTNNCSSVTTVTKGDNVICLCKGEGGNPPANVAWYKGKEQIGGTGKEEQILRLINVDKKDSGEYTCVAKGHELAKNETSFELIVKCKYII
jgi:hypothetical protein